MNSFTNPKTIPHDYKVVLLTTQYRSIPEIGEVFSHLAYGGVLKHHRLSESQQSLPVEGIALNIILLVNMRVFIDLKGYKERHHIRFIH